MERLTKSKLTNGFVVCYLENDSGLPEFVTTWNPYRKIVKKLKEYEDLEEQGKLLKPPCAVGDTVYQCMVVGFDETVKKLKYEIFKAKVFKFSVSSGGMVFWTQTMDAEKHQNVLPVSAFGKNVFLTQEEAEAVLKDDNNLKNREEQK